MKKLLLPIALFAAFGCVNAGGPQVLTRGEAMGLYPNSQSFAPGAYDITFLRPNFLLTPREGRPDVIVTGAPDKRGA